MPYRLAIAQYLKTCNPYGEHLLRKPNPIHSEENIKIFCMSQTTKNNIGLRKKAFCKQKALGWIQGFEPWASRATIWRASQLRYTHHKFYI